MRCAVLLSCLGIITLLACGQTDSGDAQVTMADVNSSRIRLYDYKSALCQTKQPDSAVFYASEGLKLARRTHDYKGEALLMNRFARINEEYDNYTLAIKYQEGVLNIYNNLHMPDAVNAASVNLAFLLAKSGQLEAGTQLLKNTLLLYQKRSDTLGMINVLSKLGAVNELQAHKKQALQFYEKAEALHKGQPVTDSYIDLLSHIGKLHAGLNNHSRAMLYYQKGIVKSNAGKHVRGNIKLLNHTGQILDSLGYQQQALDYHNQGLQKARTEGLREEEARSLIGIASTLKSQDAEGSITHLKNALQIAHSIGHKHLAAEIYHSLANIYREQSRYEEAMKALQEHHRLLDSLLDANKAHKIAVLQSSYDLAASKLKVETLELSNREKTYQRNLGVFAAVFILIISFILAGYFYKTNRLNKRLKALNVIKDKLFSIIGHDLRNPIGGITQLLAIMQESDVDEAERQQMIAEMYKQGKVTLEILNTLLKWGEAQLKGIHINPSVFNAKSSICKNIEALRVQAAEKSIVVTEHIADDLNVYGDVNHFEFIVRNLISNAIKFSYQAGRVEVDAKMERKVNRVIFMVKDQGKGISKLQQKQFLSADMDVAFGTGGEKGTGIGLMLSKEFIKANNGRIWLESEEGKGSTFYFDFPIHG